MRKSKACISVEGVNAYRRDYEAINIVYRSLQKDREQADISDIIRQLHQIVDEAIETQPDRVHEPSDAYDISKIDFGLLRQEFERTPAKNTAVQSLKCVIERRLQRLLQQNPLRTDFQLHYEQIVAEYNGEKDRVAIEKTFEALMRLVREMSVEESRASREGLDEESLAVYDLLRKQDLSADEITRVKHVAVRLLDTLKKTKLRANQWREKESSRDAVRNTIRDFLWSDETGLPLKAYSEKEVFHRASDVFTHVYRAYPVLPSPFYAVPQVQSPAPARSLFC